MIYKNKKLSNHINLLPPQDGPLTPGVIKASCGRRGAPRLETKLKECGEDNMVQVLMCEEDGEMWVQVRLSDTEKWVPGRLPRYQREGMKETDILTVVKINSLITVKKSTGSVITGNLVVTKFTCPGLRQLKSPRTLGSPRPLFQPGAVDMSRGGRRGRGREVEEEVEVEGRVLSAPQEVPRESDQDIMFGERFVV